MLTSVKIIFLDPLKLAWNLEIAASVKITVTLKKSVLSEVGEASSCGASGLKGEFVCLAGCMSHTVASGSWYSQLYSVRCVCVCVCVCVWCVCVCACACVVCVCVVHGVLEREREDIYDYGAKFSGVVIFFLF